MRVSPRLLLLVSLALYAMTMGFVSLCRSPTAVVITTLLATVFCTTNLLQVIELISVIYQAFPERQDTLVVFNIVGASSLGYVIGALGAGLAVTLSDWGYAFVFAGAFFSILVPLGYFCLPNIDMLANARNETQELPGVFGVQQHSTSWRNRLLSFDWVGELLLVIGLGLLCRVLTMDELSRDWKRPPWIVLLVVGVAFMACLVL